MINATQLLADLTRRLSVLESDLRGRLNDVPELKLSLQTEWQSARDAERTAETFESWADQIITQAGVHWLLSCVFLRFIEDNNLVDRPWIGGTPDTGRLNLARDRHEAYFRENPLETDREYLHACFREAGRLPGLHTFFDEAHNPVFRLGISGDAAMSLRQFWQQQDPNTGALLHDFTDSSWNTRFLGDIYQDLSEATRKRYALLQTPEFVEEFILDRTLTPAIREFGYQEVRMIDPTCGSGHFLLGGFYRIIDEWSRNEPNRNRRDVAQKALDAVSGVDLNPFAVAISRFRLLVAALQASDVFRLAEAPDFRISVAIGDSLLHGTRFGLTATEEMFTPAEYSRDTGLIHAYDSEDLTEVQRILGRQYHAVVGNPPYIVVKDASLNAAYRRQYTSCHMKYSLGCPFTERFFELAITGNDRQSAGFVGEITTNSFMKREFGSKLIEHVLPRLDVTHVIDTSGAHIPGHGTPTVILFGRHRLPTSSSVRTVMGIKGEPGTPVDASRGLVWLAILAQVDSVGSESEFVSVADTPRIVFGRHPWSLGGGGASDLKETIEEDCQRLEELVDSIGITSFTLEDDVFIRDVHSFIRYKVPVNLLRPMVVGDEIRDWSLSENETALFPYDDNFVPIELSEQKYAFRVMWPYRTNLGNNKMFGQQTKVEAGLKWWEFGRLTASKLRTPLTITFAFVATHNHFILDRGGKVFKQSALVIKLPSTSGEDDHLSLLGLLNSSTACFWGRQTFFPKGGFADGKWQERLEWDATKLQQFPVSNLRPLSLTKRLDCLAKELSELTSIHILENEIPSRERLNSAKIRSESIRRTMISLQEELDWHCYKTYGLTQNYLNHDNPPEICFGERAFEIYLARNIASSTESTIWFSHHSATPITELPTRWSADYRRIVEQRIELIERQKHIRLIERPEYKRRWHSQSWDELEKDALRNWLLCRLESARYWPTGAGQPEVLTTTSKLSDLARTDIDFQHIAALYEGHSDFDLGQLVSRLVASESIPFLPVLRYSASGLRKRAQWEEVWALQRREDLGETVTRIPVPPKYKQVDFLKLDYWQLRGGVDVPKERWVSFPGCERGGDGSMVIAWAGWDHFQQATAIATYYIDMKDNEGWTPTQLQPLLASLQELVPWLKQWHNDLHPTFGERMGNYYEGFVAEEARALGFTLEGLRAWRPATTVATRRRRTASTSTNV